MKLAQTVSAPEGIYNPALDPSIGTGEGSIILGKYIAQILAAAFIFGGIFLMAMILWAAYDWMLSGADENRLQAAKKRLTSALAGFIVLIALRAILAFLASVLHVEWLETLKIVWPDLL